MEEQKKEVIDLKEKSDIKEKYRKKVIELSTKGQSYEEIVSSVSHDVVDGRAVLNEEAYKEAIGEEFRKLVKEYEHLAYAWWVAQGRMYLTGNTLPSSDKLNYQVWYANMKHRFGWVDVTNVNQKIEVSFTKEEREERLGRLRDMLSSN